MKVLQRCFRLSAFALVFCASSTFASDGPQKTAKPWYQKGLLEHALHYKKTSITCLIGLALAYGSTYLPDYALRNIPEPDRQVDPEGHTELTLPRSFELRHNRLSSDPYEVVVTDGQKYYARLRSTKLRPDGLFLEEKQEERRIGGLFPLRPGEQDGRVGIFPMERDPSPFPRQVSPDVFVVKSGDRLKVTDREGDLLLVVVGLKSRLVEVKDPSGQVLAKMSEENPLFGQTIWKVEVLKELPVEARTFLLLLGYRLDFYFNGPAGNLR